MFYLDHAATTPMRPAAVDAVFAHLGDVGNPSSLHAAGRRVRAVVEAAREQIAEVYGADPVEVIFTSGGTEADNLAVLGVYRAARRADPRRTRLLISPVEHHAVLDAAEALRRTDGASIDWLPVDAAGRVRVDALEEELGAHAGEIALLAVMWANNETGTIQPVAEIAALAADAGLPLHVDAVQAAGPLSVDFASVPATSIAVTGHKLGGPVGTGALLLRRDARIDPVGFGGGQERSLRSGTLDAAGAAGFAAAAVESASNRHVETHRVTALRGQLVAGVRRAVPDAVLAADASPTLPGIAHLCFPGTDGEALLLLLDRAQVCASTGSACTSGVARASHVLQAMGYDEKLARGALRFSLGHTSTAADVCAAVEAIGPAVGAARQAAGGRRRHLRGGSRQGDRSEVAEQPGTQPPGSVADVPVLHGALSDAPIADAGLPGAHR